MAKPDNAKVHQLPLSTPAPEHETHTEAAPAAAPVQAPVASPHKKRSRRPLIIGGIALVALAAAVWYGQGYYFTGRFMVSTDDAYIGGDIATISSKLAGYVASVEVSANQIVKAGDPLVTIDSGDYIIARDQAVAQIDIQQLTLKRIDAQIVGAQAAVTQANAQKLALQAAQRSATLAQSRADGLAQRAVGSQATLDQANVALDQANANLAAGDAQIAAAEANVTVLQGQRAEAEGNLKMLQLGVTKAERDLGFTVLRAPYDGVVGNLSVQTGDLVSAGARLAAIVPTHALYIDANFKETQLPELVVGETVNIHVDAIEGDPIKGVVESISPASGSVFSLLPAQNATGNFTKVVQRVPVRIALPEEALATGKLRAGLSVVVDVDTRTAPADHN